MVKQKCWMINKDELWHADEGVNTGDSSIEIDSSDMAADWVLVLEVASQKASLFIIY